MKKDRILGQAKKIGSTATTYHGAIKYLIAHKSEHLSSIAGPRAMGDSREPLVSAKESYDLHRTIDSSIQGDSIRLTGAATGYRRVPLPDAGASARSRDAAQKNNPRKKNLFSGIAKINGPAHRERVEKIHYKGRFKGYSGSEIYADYQSCVGCSRSGKCAIIITESVFLRRILAPSDLRFSKDANGILVKRISGGMDYHPTGEDWLAKDFWTRVRAGLAHNFVARRAAKKAEKKLADETKKSAKIAAEKEAVYQRQIKSTRVTLEDSRRAGNCIEGSLAFAERKLGLSRQEIIDAGYLFSVPATTLISHAGENIDQVNRAVRIAWVRETEISI